MEAIYIGQIIQWAGTWIPEGWAACNGQSLYAKQYPALYSLIANLYGGDTTNFNLPNMNGALPVGLGPAPGMLQPYLIGKGGGEANHVLATSELPPHNHPAILTGAGINLQLKVSQDPATESMPTANLVPAAGASPGTSGGDSVDVNLYSTAGANSQMSGITCSVAVSASSVTVNPTGGGARHNNMMPYLPMYYIISLNQGMYPEFP